MQQYSTDDLIYEIQVINMFGLIKNSPLDVKFRGTVFRGPKFKLEWKMYSSPEHKQNEPLQVTCIFIDGL